MITKKLTQIARLTYKRSLTNDLIDTKKVHKILNALASEKPQGISRILKAYRRLIAEKLAQEEIAIEAVAPLTKQAEKSLLKKTGAKRINFKANPDVVFGAKITHADWIWDATLDSKLEKLTTNYELPTTD